jgi:hypothetical protein
MVMRLQPGHARHTGGSSAPNWWEHLAHDDIGAVGGGDEENGVCTHWKV